MISQCLFVSLVHHSCGCLARTPTHVVTGDCIYVPTAWAHSVRNLSPVAFDLFNPEHYHLYAETAGAASKYFESSNADDYMCVPEVMRNTL